MKAKYKLCRFTKNFAFKQNNGVLDTTLGLPKWDSLFINNIFCPWSQKVFRKMASELESGVKNK